jgi:hypothetical protein
VATRPGRAFVGPGHGGPSPRRLPQALTSSRDPLQTTEPGAGRGTSAGGHGTASTLAGAGTCRPGGLDGVGAQAGCGTRLSNSAMPAAVFDAGTK